MLGLSRSSGSWRAWTWRAVTAVAFLAQCWIAAAPLAEGRGLGAPAHVEGAGTSKHFAHDAADCPACAVMALQSLAPRVELPAAPPIVRPAAAVGRVLTLPPAGLQPLPRTRAPPLER